MLANSSALFSKNYNISMEEGSSDFEPFKPIEKAVQSYRKNGFFSYFERLILRRGI